MLFSLHWIVIYDIQFLFKKNLANLRDIRHSWVEVASLLLAKAIYLTLMIAVPICRLDAPWSHVLLGFVVMHFSISLVFVYSLIGTHFCEEAVFPQANPDGHLEGSWASHQLATSFDYLPTSRLANFLLGGFNCHVAHHLFPDVCHIHDIAISNSQMSTTSTTSRFPKSSSRPARSSGCRTTSSRSQR
jgi:linoleoyl-CoA desaturase